MLLAGGGQRLPSKINIYVKDFHQIQSIKVSSIIKQDKKIPRILQKLNFAYICQEPSECRSLNWLEAPKQWQGKVILSKRFTKNLEFCSMLYGKKRTPENAGNQQIAV